jgi:hypothetical protein
MLRVTFKDSTARDKFCDRFKLFSHVGDNQADIGWHLLQFAKLDPDALDYDELTVLAAQEAGVAHTPQANDFIVKGDPAVFGAHATVKQDLGNGFYLVESNDGTMLGDHVDSIEHNNSGMTYLVNDISMSVDNSTTSPYDLNSNDAQWHRIRVASRYRPLVSAYALHDVTYNSRPEVIVMDSGINFNHDEFNYPDLETENFYALPYFNGNFNDDKGHGTSVSSLICGKNLGIASHIKLVSVKIGSPDHNATLQEVGDAMDAILNRIVNDPLTSRIINMSWGVARSSWLDSKVAALMAAGATVVCAAGNQGIDVADISPAGIPEVITVGSIDKYDIPSGFNNISPSDAGITSGHGLSLDLFAPGENVVFAKNSSNSSYYIGSGTSLSAPLVAGVGAVIAGIRSGLTGVAELKNIILGSTTKDALLFEDDTFSENQNNLLYITIADPNITYKNQDMASYIGYFAPPTFQGALKTDVISIDLKSCFTSTEVQPLVPNETFKYSVSFDDPAIGTKYSSFFSLDEDTGLLAINRPTVSLDSNTKLEMVTFRAVLSSPSIRMESHKIFFFQINSDVEVTTADLASALTPLNSISFYVQWGSLK